jgi:hypothetical protein
MWVQVPPLLLLFQRVSTQRVIARQQAKILHQPPKTLTR